MSPRADVWARYADAERVRTDQRFKTLYGRDLYMRQMLNAAREARGQAMLPAP